MSKTSRSSPASGETLEKFVPCGLNAAAGLRHSRGPSGGGGDYRDGGKINRERSPLAWPGIHVEGAFGLLDQPLNDV